ncbi:Hypothetical Protein FCC1311_041162 [Hondaea fermentalgiana]|uniref:Uncharacterized protein n=1 Tax=Hondaea fermentalgiana TaxID=2315210 RepID=A0A2R5GGW9_9STRA|nr:Hypothetical Protein FCC1311_041162 [Hondaea fermentalgiana]|eukprot:GBG27893.1 Hypothetical Protein FCC1311_041162 [Hondaea fermentalgiana]
MGSAVLVSSSFLRFFDDDDDDDDDDNEVDEDDEDEKEVDDGASCAEETGPAIELLRDHGSLRKAWIEAKWDPLRQSVEEVTVSELESATARRWRSIMTTPAAAADIAMVGICRDETMAMMLMKRVGAAGFDIEIGRPGPCVQAGETRRAPAKVEMLSPLTY